jgi:hypothetical protein
MKRANQNGLLSEWVVAALLHCGKCTLCTVFLSGEMQV